MAKLLGTSPKSIGGFMPLYDSVLTHCDYEDFYEPYNPYELSSSIKTESELFGDQFQSISGDIKRIEEDEYNLSILDNYANNIKKEIRNFDCMWSGDIGTKTSCNSAASGMSDSGDIGTKTSCNSAASSMSDSGFTSAAPLSVVTGGNATSAPIVVMANNSKLHKLQMSVCSNIKTEIKTEPHSADFEQQLQQHSIPNKQTSNSTVYSNIPPGQSLLLKSQAQPRKKHQNTLMQIPTINTSEFVRERDNISTSSSSSPICVGGNAFGRPDTPSSLEDDAHSSGNNSHNVDLSACVMGSNNIPLTDDVIINQVREYLIDGSAKCVKNLSAGVDLTDVMDVINSAKSTSGYSSSSSTSNNGNYSTSAFPIYYKKHNYSETEEEDEIEERDDEDNESFMDGSVNSEMADDSQYQIGSPLPSIDSSSNSSHQYQFQQQHHSDHSYTRCKNGIDANGMETPSPSDSDEEIDVVSIGEKKWPTNPSDSDRKVLQTKVFNKFSNAPRIVKTAAGIRTIPPRRRSYELPYTPASSSPVKSVANSRYPSPASTPYQNQYGSSKILSDVTKSSINVLGGGEKSRKRMNGGSMGVPSHLINSDYGLPSGKKHRGKKSKHNATSTSTLNTNAAAIIQRQYSLDETADTIEKRTLHNDMERQRRIGLKNLFEALKKQIPSIKDKERAPKVNILREAAKLCEHFTREEQHLNEQKSKLKEEFRRLQERYTHLRALRHEVD